MVFGITLNMAILIQVGLILLVTSKVFSLSLGGTTPQDEELPGFLDDGYLYIPLHQASYKLHKNPQKWTIAVATCCAEGASLVLPSSMDEINSIAYRLDIKTSLWIGANDIFNEGEFKTLDGKSLNDIYHPWGSHEPNNINNEDCVSLVLNSKFNDALCSLSFPFVCKKERRTRDNYSCKLSDVTEDGQIFRPDYHLLGDSSAFYKLHRSPSSWTDALQTCCSEGAHLVAPETCAEAQLLAGLLGDAAPTAWLGIYDIFSEGDFVTLHGTTLSSIYSNWDPNEPDNMENEDCVVIHQNGTYSDVGCTVRHNFICKREASTLGMAVNCEYPKIAEDGKFFRKDYIFMSDAFYKHHTSKMSWFDAYSTCADESAGLVAPKSMAEVQLIRNVLKPNTTSVWLGIHDMFSEGIYQDLRGNNIVDEFSNWAKNEPNDNGGEDCILMYADGKYNDDKCHLKFQFVCKKNASEVISNPECNTYDPGYFLVRELGRCYKLHTSARSWHDAFRTCSSEMSQLAMADSEQEAALLALTLSGRAGPVHQSFHDLFSPGRYLTTTGISIDSTPYTNLTTHKASWKQHCGMLNSGALGVHDCREKSMFFCEKIVLNKYRRLPELDQQGIAAGIPAIKSATATTIPA